MDDKLELYMRKIYRDMKSLRKGNNDIFETQTSCRVLMRKLRLTQEVLTIVHKKRLLFIGHCIKQASSLEKEAAYHIALERLERRHNSKGKCDDKHNECPICYNRFCKKWMIKTDCNHTFCRKCIKRCLKNSPNCPICRVTIASCYNSVE